VIPISRKTLTTPSPTHPFDINRIEKIVDKYTPIYNEKTGIGSCGPVSQMILNDIKAGAVVDLFKNGNDISNWRLGFSMYNGTYPHFVVVHINNKNKPDMVLDAANYLHTEKTEFHIILPGNPDWKKYVNDDFEVSKEGEDIVSFADIYDKSDIDFWKKVWGSE